MKGGQPKQSAMEWYYTKDKMQVGPVSHQELIRKISVGEVSSNEFAWHEGVADWQPISSFSELQITSAFVDGSVPSVPSVSSPTSAQQSGKTSSLAIASLCLGIGSIVLCGILMGIPALICGHVALGEIKRSDGRVEGKPMAIIGLILGYFSIVATVVMVLIFLLMSGAAVSNFDSKSYDKPCMLDGGDTVPLELPVSTPQIEPVEMTPEAAQ